VSFCILYVVVFVSLRVKRLFGADLVLRLEWIVCRASLGRMMCALNSRLPSPV
jgi:hypothetical protein